jgi:hypothetical protein
MAKEIPNLAQPTSSFRFLEAMVLVTGSGLRGLLSAALAGRKGSVDNLRGR